MPLSDAGYIAYTASEWEAIFQAQITARFTAQGLDAPDFTADTVLGNLSLVIAALLAEIDGYFEAGISFAFDPNSATGDTLDALCALVGISRQLATKAGATVTLTGTAGVVVPAGTLFEGGTSDLFARWTLDAAATIGGGGTVSATVTAVDAGYLTAAAGTITRIATPIAGLSAVTNPAAAVAGQDAEDDSALRLRRTQALSVPGGGSVASLRAKLLELDFVDAATVIDNPSSLTAVVSGITLNPHAMGVLLSPSTFTDAQKAQIADIIYQNTPAGIQNQALSGAVAVTVVGGDGYTKTVYYSTTTTLTINVVAVLTVKPGYTVSGLTQAVKDAITAYINGLGVGEIVYYLQGLVAIGGVEGVGNTTLTLNGVSANVTPGPYERPVVGTITVS